MPTVQNSWKPAAKQGLERWKELIYSASPCGYGVGRKRSTELAAHLAKPACLQGVGRMQFLTPSCYQGGQRTCQCVLERDSSKKSQIGIADLIWELDQIQSDTGSLSFQAEQ